MAGISSKSAGTIQNKRKYNDYELNTEFDINLYESFYRSHDPQIGRFLQIDPKPSEFESLYTAMGNNPILNFDILGDVFDVANNKESKDDIYSLVRNGNKKYVNISDEGSVSIDFKKLSDKKIGKLLKNDEGLALIYDLYKAKEKYLYESSEIALYTGENYNKRGDNMYSSTTGNLNASNGGTDDNGEHRQRPKTGYDGQVVILPNYKKEEQDNTGTITTKSRSASVFHELAENYERTTNGVNFSLKSPSGKEIGAHVLANIREAKWWNASVTPGSFVNYYRPNVSIEHLNELQIIIDKYVGGK